MRNAMMCTLAPLMIALLSGCTADAPAEEAESGVAVVTSPDDYAYTADPRVAAHIHDYWGGRDQVEILHKEARSIPFESFGRNYSAFTFLPEPDSVVPQGTAEVVVTASFTDGTAFTHEPPELWIKDAAHRDFVSYGPIKSGMPLAIASTNAMNDIPHQRLSAWEFHVRIQHVGAAYGTWYGEIEMRVDAVRGLEIPAFAAHPEQWQGRDVIPLYDWESPLNRLDIEVADNTFFTSNHERPAPLEGARVPYDADHVEVVLTIIDGGFATFGGLDLLYHGADSHEWQLLTPYDEHGDQRFYRIPVGGQADGPYAHETTWAFEVDSADGPSNRHFHIRADVHRLAPAF